MKEYDEGCNNGYDQIYKELNYFWSRCNYENNYSYILPEDYKDTIDYLLERFYGNSKCGSRNITIIRERYNLDTDKGLTNYDHLADKYSISKSRVSEIISNFKNRCYNNKICKIGLAEYKKEESIKELREKADIKNASPLIIQKYEEEIRFLKERIKYCKKMIKLYEEKMK